MVDPENGWYWCLKHHQVEPYEGDANEDRLGPYATREEAMHALQIAQQRNEAYDNDPRWNDPKDDEDGDGEDDDSHGWGPFKS